MSTRGAVAIELADLCARPTTVLRAASAATDDLDGVSHLLGRLLLR